MSAGHKAILVRSDAYSVHAGYTQNVVCWPWEDFRPRSFRILGCDPDAMIVRGILVGVVELLAMPIPGGLLEHLAFEGSGARLCLGGQSIIVEITATEDVEFRLSVAGLVAPRQRDVGGCLCAACRAGAS